MNKNRLLQTVTLLFALGISGYLFASDPGGGNSPCLSVVDNVKWQAERSWLKLMAGIDKIFDANASLDVADKGSFNEHEFRVPK